MPQKGLRRSAGGGAVVAIVAAAGEGLRAGHRVPKQFLRAGGRPLLRIAVQRLAAHPLVDAVVVVVPAARLRRAAAILRGLPKVAAIVTGGARRQDSVARGLAADAALRAEILLVHDAARPLVPPEVVSAVIREARRSGAAVPGLEPSDTVKEVDASGRIVATRPRERIRLVQTPQGFRADLLRRACRAAEASGLQATDEAAIVEAAGGRVRVVPGSPLAFKVTTPEDLRRVRALVRGRRETS